MSWEQLELTADAHHRDRAELVLQIMVAAQGDADGWKAQQKRLIKLLE
jgi:hypothetical protein